MGSNTKRTEQGAGPANAAPASSRARAKRVLPIRSSPVSTAPSLRAKLTALKSPPKARARATASAHAKSKPTFTRNPLLQELEPRLLMSADLSPLAHDTLLASPALTGAEFRNIADHGTPTVLTSAAIAPIQRTNELVFVDTATPDYRKLIDSIRESALAQGRNLEFVLIDADKDGIRKITDTLTKKSDLDAIHIISHAQDGSVQLGSSRLDFETLLKRAAAVKQWGSALTEDGDILFYGCDLAATEKGQSLLEAMSRLTGADVAASDDLTGAAAKGGDWDLEFHTGAIETAVAVSPPEQGEWDHLLATFTVTNANDAGAGSLRDAIGQANANGIGLDTINFNIGSGLQTITLASTLNILGAVNLDATTQPGAGTTPRIELNGNGAAIDAIWMNTNASGSTIRGLAIDRFNGDGIILQDSSNNVIAGNFIGTDPTGTLTGRGNLVGVLVQGNSTNNRIGGTTAADRNVISGNTVDGVQLVFGGTTGNRVQGNYIGVDASGTVALKNTNQGVAIFNSANGNTIGGTAANAGNVISGNGGTGVLITSVGTNGNIVQGNLIGTDKNGVGAIGNSSHGVAIDSNSNNTIGGTAANAANTIANNGGAGVMVITPGGPATGNVIRGNSIYSNGGLGIDLGNNGVTANDAGDADAGPNSLQNFPVLTGAYTDGGSTVAIAGSLNSTANGTFRVEFFASASADASGYGEGQRYLGFVDLYTDASGNASFVETYAASVAVGEVVSATATNLATGSTSEYGQARTTGGALVITTTNDVVDGNTSSVANLVASKGADGKISLREAIIATNNTLGLDSVFVPSGTYMLSIVGAAEELAATGDLDLRDPLILAGAGASTTTINGGGIDRVFSLINSSSAYLTGVTVTGGNVTGDAGAFYLNSGGESLVLTHAVLSGNVAGGGGLGGAIRNVNGSLTMYDVRVTGNTASAGGGIYNNDAAFITDSLVDNNSAVGNGGGIDTTGPGSALTLVNVTLSGNLAGNAGGGLRNGRSAVLQNVTITNNTANVGGGLGVGGGSPTTSIRNTIIAGNTQAGGTGPDVNGTIQSAGYNIVGNNLNSSGWVASDQQNVNPMLGALASNGGSTMTHSLQMGSPAINAGISTGAPLVDQRDYLRDAQADIGAFEYNGASQVVYAISGRISHDVNGDSSLAGDSGQSGVTVYLFQDGTDGIADGADDTWIATATTDVNGDYSFGGLAEDTYWVVVNSKTFSAGPALWAEQTRGSAGALGPSGYLAAAGALYGGRNATLSDNASTLPSDLDTAEHVTRVIVAGADVANVDSGFSFSAIVNARGDNTDDDGGATGRMQQGSLRQFILNSNAIAGVQTSYFSIGGGGAQTIAPTAVLPVVTDAVVLDATTQGGFAGTPLIELDGAGSGGDGFNLAANGSTVRGFVINRFADSGIHVDGDNNAIVGNWIGLDATGTGAAGNGIDGVVLLSGAANNTIGGIGANDRNVISGNGDDGVSIDGAAGTVVIGNYIGLDAAGTTAVGNGGDGVAIQFGAVGSIVGGTSAAERNVISGNGSNAANGLANVRIREVGTTGNTVLGNYLGTNWNGSVVLANARYGVLVSQDATGNTIGGTAPGAGNTIVGSTLDGIAVINTGSGNRILGNSVHTNGGLGIDLADDNVTANDAGDADAGGNNRQNFPVLASAFVSGGNVTISGSLNSTAGSTFRIEFFANAVPTPGADASGNGEGQRYLGFMNVVTDGAGNVTFTSPALAGVVAGEIISATATDLTTGDTSEFAANLTAVTPGSISGTLYHDVDGDADVAEAGTLTFAGATVSLYLDDGDGVIDAGDTLVTTTATDGAGLYGFTGLLNGTYYVVVDSKTLTADPDVWAEQTYGAAGAANNAAGTSFTGAAGALYGGRNATVSDAAAALATAEHVTQVAVAGAVVANVDSGFSFNVVTNVRGDATDDDLANARMQQGTLRQFILNANAIGGPNAMRFVPAVAANDTDGLGNNWWQITLTSALPQITGADTTIDGTAYSAADGATIVNSNNATLGYVGAVGLGADATPGTGDEPTLTGVNGAELELVNANTLGAGLDVQADDATIQYLAIHGFNTGDWLNDGDIRIGTVDGAVIRHNILGTGPAAQSDPGAGARSATGINIANSTGGTLQGNVIAYVENFGVRLSGSNGWTVQGNDLAFTGLVEDQLDGIDANDGTGNIVVTGNMFRSNRGIGFDSYAGAGGNAVTDNSFIANGQGGSETAGARLFGGGNTVTRNLFQGNFGPAIIVVGDDAPTAGAPSNDNLISRNSFSGNTRGIDLVGAFADNNHGDGVSTNDGATNPGAGNFGVDFPVVASAINGGATTTVSGTAGTGVTQVEVYRATPGIREGVQYLGTAVVAGGNWSIGVTGLVVGDEVTAIGTDVTGNTSEFCGNVTVVPVNVAPTLNGGNNLAAIAEDAAGNAGTLVSALIVGQVTDPDVGSLSGIAVTAVSNTNGIWEYSLNGGGSWNAIAPVSNASALLLASDAATRVRFVPGADWNGSVAGLTFRAWDQFTGTAGTNVDTSVNGGASAFSTATATASVTVNPINDAPTRLAAAAILASVAEDAGNPPGATVSSLFGVVFSDATDQVTGGSSANNLAGIAITSNAANGGTEGTWQWFNGAVWAPISTAVATNSALVLGASTLVRFLPVADYSGTPGGLTVRLIDSSAGAVASGATVDVTVSGGTTVYSSAANAVTLGTSVTPVNDAPVLDTTKAPALANEAEDAPAPVGAVGTLVSSLVDFAVPAGQVDNVGDVDAGAILGIAITAADTANGSWFYSTNNGGTWNALGAVAPATARLLAVDANARLYFQPVADFNGSIAAAITFRIWDQTTGVNGALADTTVNGGTSAFSVATDTAALTVTAVNDAPIAGGVATLAAVLEDAATPSGVQASTLFGGDYSDAIDGAGATALSGIAIVGNTSTAGQGTWQYATVPVGPWTNIPVAGLGDTTALVLPASYYLRFLPAANYNGTPGSLTVRLSDGSAGAISFSASSNITVAIGGTGNWSSASVPLDTSVTAVNDAPAGTNTTVTTLEDTAYVFTAADFGFTDPADVPANTQLAVTITTLPGAGTLTLSGLAVVAGQSVSLANITAGNLVFTPAADQNGAGYASFTFQVQDDGGVANGGVDLDPTPNTITIDVASVNDAPAGTNSTVTTLEDTGYLFTAADFGFTDPADAPANALLAVTITTLPGPGALTLAGVGVLAGQSISLANITAGNLVFTSAAGQNGVGYASFTFQVQDDGGVLNGGVALDASPNTMTIDVTAVNDAPAGTDNTVTTLEDTGYVFTAADFGFADPSDAPANALLAVRITSLPASGALTNNGVALNAGDFVAAADIALGRLVFTPAADQNGAGYASFTFRVQDDGGGLNGGIDLDPAPNTITIDVTAVNDAPVLGGSGFAVKDGETIAIGTAGLSATDVDDAATSLVFNVGGVTRGHFELVSALGVAIASFTQQQVLNGDVRFVHDGSGLAPSAVVSVSDGKTGVGPYTLNITFTGLGAAAVSSPPPGGSIGGGSPPIEPPPLPAQTQPASSGSRSTNASSRTPTTPPADGGDDGQQAEIAAPIAAVSTASAKAEKAIAAEMALPTGRIEGESIEAKPLSSEIQVEPVRVEMEVLPMRRDVFDNPNDEERQSIEVIMGTVRVTGLAFSVGAVWWAARAAGLMASLLASSPAWRHVDPLPVLGRDDEEEKLWDEDAGDEDADQDRKDDEHRAAWVLEEREAS